MSGRGAGSWGWQRRVAARLLAPWLDEADRSDVLRDLDELRRSRRRQAGAARAEIYYWRQLLRYPARLAAERLRRRLPGSTNGSRARPVVLLDGLRQDLRLAVRGLFREPTFTLVVVATLALAIGVNTAIFSMVNVVVFPQLPIEDPGTFVQVRGRNVEQGVERAALTETEFLAYWRQVDSLQSVEALREGSALLTDRDAPTRVQLMQATPGLLEAWGVRVAIGRDFVAADAEPGARPVALLGHGFWRWHFGADRGVLGEEIVLDGESVRVIGVIPERVEYGDMARIDLWRPLRPNVGGTSSGVRDLWVGGRLARDVSAQEAQAELGAIAARLERDGSEAEAGWTVVVIPVDETLTDEGFRTILMLLTLAVTFVLLIACANVATMLLGRDSARTREIAVRTALGANRGRLVSQLLVESGVLAVLGAASGLLVARALLGGMAWMAGRGGGMANLIALLEIDRNVLLMTATLAVAAPMLFGLVPALRVTGLDPAARLGGRGRGGLRRESRTRTSLVVAQVALALTLMGLSSLLARSALHAERTDLGFDPGSVLSFRVALPADAYPDAEARLAFLREATRRVQEQPAIGASGWTSHLPYVQFPPWRSFAIVGRPAVEPDDRPQARVISATPGFLELTGLTLLQGSGWEPEETGQGAGGPMAAIVNEEAVRRFWPGADPLGAEIELWMESEGVTRLQVVGVVNSRSSLSQDISPAPRILVPVHGTVPAELTLVIAASGDLSAAAAAVRGALQQADPDLPTPETHAMTTLLDDRLGPLRTISTLFVTFAGFALLMACTGIYGTLSFAVARRTREIGIRRALGARDGTVLGILLRQMAWLVGAGLLLGLPGAWLVSRILVATTGIADLDGALLLAIAAILGFTAALAGCVPALRAVSVDPGVVLREP